MSDLRQVDRVMLETLKHCVDCFRCISETGQPVGSLTELMGLYPQLRALLTEQPEPVAFCELCERPLLLNGKCPSLVCNPVEPDAPQEAKECLAEVLRLIRRGRHYECEVQQGSLVAKAQLENLKVVLYDYCDAIEGRTAPPTSVEPDRKICPHPMSHSCERVELQRDCDQYKEKLDTLVGLVREYKLAEDDQAHAPKSIRVARADLFAYLDKLAAERPAPEREE